MIAEHRPRSLSIAIFAGHVTTGRSVSWTVTVNEQADESPPASVAVHVTCVAPFWKVEPDGGLHSRRTPGQLSVAIFVSNTTTAVHLPGSFACVIVPGQCITGCSVSATETVNLHVSFGATPLEATQLTSVVPLENAVPDGGVQTIAGGGHPL